MSLKVISFKICPYVQRSLITLNHASYPYDIEYINLAEPPEWFNEVSPLGKVPVVIVDDEHVIFESAVINEYVNEITESNLLPQNPLEKAKQRAWIEYVSSLMVFQFQAFMAKEEADFEDSANKLIQGLTRLEEIVQTPLAYGEQLSLLDTSIAPIFMRIRMVPRLNEKFEQICGNHPKIKIWADNLLNLESVKNSVPEDFESVFKMRFGAQESFALS